MYKVFLVEDEDLIRTRIRENFNWEENGFVFAGEAPDGEVAISLIKEIEPDIVVTDIKMPFMDGLELSRLLKNYMPWIKIIIISGHDDFKYAKEAISLGVSEYILKPVKPADLADILKKVADVLDEENRKIKELENYEKTIEESVSVLREKFLLETVMYGKTPADIIEKAYSLEVNLRAKYYTVLDILFEGDRNQESDREYHEILKLDALIKKLLSSATNVLSCSPSVDETILIITADTHEIIETISQNLSDEIVRQSKSLIVGTVRIGIGQICTRFSELKNSYAGAKKALDYNYVFKDRDVLNEEDINHLGKTGSGLMEITLDRLKEFFKYSRLDSAADFLDTYLAPLEKNELSAGVFLRYSYLSILLAAGRFVSELSGEPEEILPELNNLDREIVDMKSISDLKIRLLSVLENVIDFRNGRNFSKYKRQIDQAKEFIDSNFSNANLSLMEAAEAANLSQCRFSTIFKQETGSKFTEYLTMARLNKACELLKTTSKLTSEIAGEVGYNDSHYFSYIFKKVNGITPTQFRESIG